MFSEWRGFDLNVNAGIEVRQSGKADDPLAYHADLELSLGNRQVQLDLGKSIRPQEYNGNGII